MFLRKLDRQIRTGTSGRIFLLEAYTAAYSFTASAFHSDRPALAEEPMALVRLAIPALTVLTVFLLRNGWSWRSERGQLAPILDVGLAFGLVLVSQVALTACLPALALPRWHPTQGSWAGWLFLTELRTLFPPRTARLPDPGFAIARHIYLDEVRWQAEELQRAQRRTRLRIYCIAAVVFTACGSGLAWTGPTTVRIGAALISAGALYAVWLVWRGDSPRPPTNRDCFEAHREFCQGELSRQSTLLRRIRASYIGLSIPGLLLVLSGQVVYVYVILMYAFLAAELLHREILRLQQERSFMAEAAF